MIKIDSVDWKIYRAGWLQGLLVKILCSSYYAIICCFGWPIHLVQLLRCQYFAAVIIRYSTPRDVVCTSVIDRCYFLTLFRFTSVTLRWRAQSEHLLYRHFIDMSTNWQQLRECRQHEVRYSLHCQTRTHQEMRQRTWTSCTTIPYTHFKI